MHTQGFGGAWVQCGGWSHNAPRSARTCASVGVHCGNVFFAVLMRFYGAVPGAPGWMGVCAGG